VAELEGQEMSFQSHSQAGQDQFAWEILGHKPGTFLDIGANHPVEKSNTYALEQMGWTGIMVENDAHCVDLLRAQRGACLLAGDATKLDWTTVALPHGGIEYLSLDVDESTLAVLRNLMAAKARFSLITLEHDAYRFGTERRDEMAELLRGDRYDILCADVCDKGLSFEIWAVDPLAVDMKKAEKFRRIGPTDWKEFFV
jgi:hypothetical protein